MEIPTILNEVSFYFNISIDKMLSKTRKLEFKEPRHIAMKIAKDETRHSYNRIGQLMGGFDHATVLSGKKELKSLCLVIKKLVKLMMI